MKKSETGAYRYCNRAFILILSIWLLYWKNVVRKISLVKVMSNLGPSNQMVPLVYGDGKFILL